MMRWAIWSLVTLPFLLPFGNPASAADPDRSEAVDEFPLEDYDREHWSFRPLQRPEVPGLEQDDWSRNPIDRFVLSRLRRKELEPMTPAPADVWLRRTKFDLVGLPPTEDEWVEFSSDANPLSRSRWIDRFLNAPGFGERWAQYWLDLARYAETDGFEHDKRRQGAWQYRQWVVDAFNQGMPYDQFVRMQMVGDRHGEPIATMFALAGPDMPDINEQDLRRHDKLNELSATVGEALLGLQIGCAQCHDHKFDPLSQADFYRLRGIFETAVPLMQRDRHVLYLTDHQDDAPARLYHRGELTSPGPKVSAKPPRIASTPEQHARFGEQQNVREAFVDWMFDRRNPLVARVVANRIWQHHFGRSLCGNPNDFGVVASEPSHPEMLDWMACELIESGWDTKSLHRLILDSATYRQHSGSGSELDASIANDPENRWYSRFPRRRLQGEVIRDALLAIGGTLNRQYGGASVLPPLPEELTSTLLKGQWPASPDQADHGRRSIYVFARRNLRYPMFDVFDRPDAGASCGRRNQSTTAIQSLQMLNGQLAIQAAQRLADHCRDERQAGRSAAEVLTGLFRRVLGREPSGEETSLLIADTTNVSQQESDTTKIDWMSICLALVNTSEFIYVD